MAQMKSFTIIGLGGSIVVPRLSDEGGIDIAFLGKFRELIFRETEKGRKFLIIVGGGKTARVYQKAASQICKVSADDLDWIGIASTQLNAQLLLATFRRDAYAEVISRKPSPKELAAIKKSAKDIFIASGWFPGQSSDYEAVYLAQEFEAKEFINASNVSFVYDKDPKQYKDAKPLKELSWGAYRKLIPSKWVPGLSTPIDPTAAKLAQKSKITAKILKGTELENLEKAIKGKEFTGTLIS